MPWVFLCTHVPRDRGSSEREVNGDQRRHRCRGSWSRAWINLSLGFIFLSLLFFPSFFSPLLSSDLGLWIHENARERGIALLLITRDGKRGGDVEIVAYEKTVAGTEIGNVGKAGGSKAGWAEESDGWGSERSVIRVYTRIPCSFYLSCRFPGFWFAFFHRVIRHFLFFATC